MKLIPALQGLEFLERTSISPLVTHLGSGGKPLCFIAGPDPTTPVAEPRLRLCPRCLAAIEMDRDVR